jgi:hypothetical protein
VPVLAVILVLVAFTVITKLPFLLFGLLVWFCLSRRHWHGAHSWDGHRSRVR